MADPNRLGPKKVRKEEEDEEEEKKEKKEKKKGTKAEEYVKGTIYNALMGLMGKKEAKKPLEKAEPDLPQGPAPQTFKEVLKSGSEEWRQAFEAWARATRRGESVDFLRAVDDYRAAPSAEALVDIVTRFLLPGSKEPLNIDDRIAQPLIDAYEACYSEAGEKTQTGKLVQLGVRRIVTRDLFDEAYEIVVTDMMEHAYGVFLRSVGK